jgi:hypothetical protein
MISFQLILSGFDCSVRVHGRSRGARQFDERGWILLYVLSLEFIEIAHEFFPQEDRKTHEPAGPPEESPIRLLHAIMGADFASSLSALEREGYLAGCGKLSEEKADPLLTLDLQEAGLADRAANGALAGTKKCGHFIIIYIRNSNGFILARGHAYSFITCLGCCFVYLTCSMLLLMFASRRFVGPTTECAADYGCSLPCCPVRLHPPAWGH